MDTRTRHFLSEWLQRICKAGIWTFQVERERVEVSQNFLKIFALKEVELSFGISQFLSYFYEKDRKYILEAFDKCHREKSEQHLNVSIAVPGGDKNILLVIQCIEEDQGQSVYGLIVDLSREKEQERLLAYAGEDIIQYENIINETSIVAKTNAQGIITYVNDNFVSISKFPRKELIGNDHRIINSGYHSKEFFKDLWETIRKGNHWHGKIKNRAKDGSFYWVDTYISPILNDERRITGYLSVRRDITKEVIQQDIDLKTAKLVAIGETTAQITHDIMNPLSVIELTAKHLRKKLAHNEDEDKKFQRLLRSVTTIKDIFANIRSVLLEDASFAPMHLFELIETSIEDHETLFKKHKIDVRYECPEQIELVGNQTQLRLVFSNLLKNAVEAICDFDKKWIRIEAMEKENKVVVKFIDSGGGIHPEIADKVFDNLFSTKLNKGGTGLGLGICQKLAHAHHAEIILDQDAANTTFSITFKTST